MTQTKSLYLQQFLSENLSEMFVDTFSGTSLKFPEFDLYARDYLRFAEHELLQIQNKSTSLDHIHLINCVSHLKRAIDCQLDTCFYILNLNTVKKNNLSLKIKLNFFKSAGIFNSFSLARFNTMRNKMEHDYKIPEIEDIEAYYDLVSALVSILESFIGTLSISFELGMRKNNISNNTFDYFNIEYIWDETPKIKCTIDKNLPEWSSDELLTMQKSDYIPQEEIIVTSEDRKNFPYFLKILLLLSRRDGFISDKHILDELQIID
ncbi:hypothetical protein JDS97_26805 [Bacillus cereus group sp. N18]|nr:MULTISPECIES: hypothetical protein [Bacillus cereus group]OFD06745.1 hypothetical protein BTGOE7_31390 [Bacillus thuringiensis]MBJ8049850.1 hypothetical protein [Bacillus cereus group sp. N18]MBJ8063586.1 hypothetical protein [Bacillus cereus group sp. N15]PEA30843.1 hypothetical protein COO13_23290 [Bacillus toyonensis]TBX50012.1 hypothetical protein E0M44_06255 [Bacillus toyonensis]